MGKEQESGTRAEVGGQPPPKPGNRLKEPSLLRFSGTVVAAVGAIVIANEVASRVRMFVESWGEAEEALEREIQAATLTDD